MSTPQAQCVDPAVANTNRPSMWHRRGTTFWSHEQSDAFDQLPKGVYLVRKSIAGFYLERLYDRFAFPKKIYGLHDSFIDRVVKTYGNTSDNLGVIMNGIRGTGKTVTAELICDRIQQPVILVDGPNDGLPEFMASIKEECIFFFDEYEKSFPREEYSSDSPLLKVMDGVLSGFNRKMFLLTTNQLTVEENLIQRPGRIRYLKTFENLEEAVIAELVKDLLIDKNRMKSVVEFIAELELITIDIVMAVVQEVNLHGEDPSAFKDVFNVKKVAEVYDVVQVPGDDDPEDMPKKVLRENVRLSSTYFVEGRDEQDDLIIPGREVLGTIIEVLAWDKIRIIPKMGDVIAAAELLGMHHIADSARKEKVKKGPVEPPKPITVRIVSKSSWNKKSFGRRGPQAAVFGYEEAM